MPDTFFIPLQDFSSPELESDYITGLCYTARSGDDLLLSLIPVWVAESKVKLVSLAQSTIQGTGA